MTHSESCSADLIQVITDILTRREIKRVTLDSDPMMGGSLTKPEVALWPGSLTKASASTLIRAAVLLPLFCKDGLYHCLFTRRTDKVKRHKGEISFPGGIYDQSDKDLKATALREAQEEIGVNPQDVQLLGGLDEVMTMTDFVVSPFVGLIPFPYPFVLSSEEIAEIIILPLSGFLKQGVLTEEDWTYQDGTAKVYTYHCGRHVIWGATAKILRQFLSLIPAERIRR
jgi:8-oxo-dGTP pyrophosphatase MutT (NUDIX family)